MAAPLRAYAWICRCGAPLVLRWGTFVGAPTLRHGDGPTPDSCVLADERETAAATEAARVAHAVEWLHRVHRAGARGRG